MGVFMEQETAGTSTAKPEAVQVPDWVRRDILPKTGSHVEAVQVLEAGPHRSVIVFTNERAYVAEKGVFHSPKLFEVFFPEKFVIEATECPHCHRQIHMPFRRVGVTKVPPGTPTATPTPTNGARAEQEGPRPQYAGKVFPLLDVEGIGATYEARLTPVGLRTTDDLLAADPDYVAATAQTTRAIVDKWYAMAELMKVKGVGKQFAELLVRSGINSIEELSRQESKDLFKHVETAQASVDVRIQGAPLNRRRVGQWIQATKALRKRSSKKVRRRK